VRSTYLGTNRASGGAYENHLLALLVFGADGLLARAEAFEANAEAEALARFDALTASSTGRTAQSLRAAATPMRRVGTNPATMALRRSDAAIAARDVDALADVIAEGHEVLDHVTGATTDRRGTIASFRFLLRAKDPTYRSEPLAILGDVLALGRVSQSAGGFAGAAFDVGAYEREQACLFEADALGRLRRVEAFPVDRLGDAVVRLYERYAELLPDGPAHARAAATARSVAANVGRIEVDRFTAALAPGMEVVDHRILGTWSARGAQAAMQHWRAWHELVDVVARFEDVLGLRHDAYLVRITWVGTDRAGGGAFEFETLNLWTFGADGLSTRVEVFDVERGAEALARFDELTIPSKRPPLQNAATRLLGRFGDAWEARDWDRVAACFAAAYRTIDRRKTVRIEFDRDAQLESLHFAFELASSRFTDRVLAIRGERLALSRTLVEASAVDEAGPSELEMLQIVEVDAHGDAVAIVVFDPDDLDAAYTALDARYLAGEAAPHAHTWEAFMGIPRAAAARDWASFAALFTPGAVMRDNRPLGLFMLLPDASLSPDAWVASVRVLFEVRPDTRFRLHHVLALDDGRSLTIQAWEGAASEGAYETPSIFVTSYGLEGIRQIDVYSVEQLDAARACYEQLSVTTPRIENAATRAFQRAFDLLLARNWEGFAALFAPSFRGIDRRKILQNELARDEWLASYRSIIEMTSSESTKDVLATRGDGLMLGRYVWRGTDGLVGPSEISYLLLIEVDDRGKHVAVVMFDPDDLDAAFGELDERYAAGEVDPLRIPPNAATRAFDRWVEWVERGDAGDGQAMEALAAPTLEYDDRRRLLRTAGGRDIAIASTRETARLRSRPSRTLLATSGDHLALERVLFTGPDDAPFEVDTLHLTEVDAEGRFAAVIIFDPEDRRAASAEMLDRYARSDAARCIPSGVFEEIRAVSARDVSRLRAVLPDNFVMHDRRRTGSGRLEGADRVVAAIAAEFEQTSEMTVELLYVVAAEKHGMLAMTHTFGTLADGGEYELVYVVLGLFQRDRYVGMELFEPEHLDVARARFEQLRPQASPPASPGRSDAGEPA
jgi:hypothetical protein